MPGTGTWIVIAAAIGITFYAYVYQSTLGMTVSDELIIAMGVILGALLITLMG